MKLQNLSFQKYLVVDLAFLIPKIGKDYALHLQQEPKKGVSNG